MAKARKKKGKASPKKKLSVKKRPVRDLDAARGRGPKGGTITGSTPATKALNFSSDPMITGITGVAVAKSPDPFAKS